MKAGWSAYVVLTALLAGAGLTAWGLAQHGLWDTRWTSDPQNWQVLGFVALAVAVTEVARRAMRWDRCIAAVVVAALIVLLAGQAGAVLALVVLAAASLVTGHAVLRALRCDATSIPWSVRLTIGAGLWGTLVGLAAHFPLAYPVTYGVALLGAAIAGRHVLRAELASLTRTRPPTFSWLDLALVALALYFTAVALMPEIGHDALATHLFVPAHLALRHGWGFDPGIYVWALMPMLGDWLYGIGYVLAGETGARLVNLGAIMLASRLVAELAAAAGADQKAARWASLVFLSTPLLLTEVSSLFIESVWSCFLLAASLMVLRLRSEGQEQVQSEALVRTVLLATGLLAGGALASKAVTFTTLPGLVLLLAACWKRWAGRAGLRSLALAMLLACVIGLIPYAWAWHVTGNPVFPFFNQVFRSPLWPPVAFDPPAIFDKGVRWDLFWRMTFDSGRYLEASPGASGFQWLLLVVPAALALAFERQRAGLWLLVFAAVSIMLTFHSTAYLRYVMPGFGWVAAAIGAAFTVLGRSWLHAVVTLALAATVALNTWFLHSGTTYGELSPQVLLGPRERERWLTERQPIRNLVGLVNTVNDSASPVGVLGPPLLAGLSADALHASWYNQAFFDEVVGAATADAVGEMLDRRRIEHVVLDAAWNTRERRELVRQATDLVAAVGEVELRRVKPRYRFRIELLRNPGFDTLDGWDFPASAPTLQEGALPVTVTRPAVQAVAVEPGRRYRLSVAARCMPYKPPAQGRLQVNWTGPSGLVHVSIRTFDCLPKGGDHAMDVTAPAGATSALVYATGHTDNPLLVEALSFRQ